MALWELVTSSRGSGQQLDDVQTEIKHCGKDYRFGDMKNQQAYSNGIPLHYVTYVAICQDAMECDGAMPSCPRPQPADANIKINHQDSYRRVRSLLGF
ncbi:hypothetical protein RRG08_048648 [Elysia crispata]|uniref:Uncharacterized protein n=1 Tax=Elysia crispata TaxID=231223 RepID=A0AAE1ACW5_9GAST|nr:hypothetical protein RRG08_048648 [Elysia crispata]